MSDMMVMRGIYSVFGGKKQASKQVALIIPRLPNIFNKKFEMIRGSLRMSSGIG